MIKSYESFPEWCCKNWGDVQSPNARDPYEEEMRRRFTALEADARRYAWFKANDAWFKEQAMSSAEIDEAIDTAMLLENLNANHN